MSSAHDHHHLDITKETRDLESIAPKLIGTGFVVGVVALALSFGISLKSGEKGIEHFAHIYLHNYYFYLTLVLGAIFFMVIQHLTRAGWSVVIRRIAENFAGLVPLMAVLAVPILAMHGKLYHWPHGADDPYWQHGGGFDVSFKALYLSMPFFYARVVLYFIVWGATAWFFRRNSIAQDRTGDPDLTVRMENFSPIAMLLYALTTTFAAFDFLMALDAHWFSTMFGVYIFSGSAVGAFALLILAALWLQGQGRLANAITKEHYHDLGKLMFGFMCFWAYVNFSQFMLMWYANIPEETMWYERRIKGEWGYIGTLMIVGHFLVPFLGFMSRWTKRNTKILAGWALWLLLMHWFDLYYVVMPEFQTPNVPLGIADLLCLIGFGGIFVGYTALVARGNSLVAERDPRLNESLAFHNY